MNHSYADYVPGLKALADETRLRIVHMLSSGDKLCACKILEEFDITQPTLSYHMKVLTESGLVNGVREGVWMQYSLNQDRRAELIQFVTEVMGDTSATVDRSSGDKAGSTGDCCR